MKHIPEIIIGSIVLGLIGIILGGIIGYPTPQERGQASAQKAACLDTYSQCKARVIEFCKEKNIRPYWPREGDPEVCANWIELECGSKEECGE